MYFVRVGTDWSEAEVMQLVEEMKDLEEEGLVVRSESFEAYETDVFDNITMNEEEVMEKIEEIHGEEESNDFLTRGTLNGLE